MVWTGSSDLGLELVASVPPACLAAEAGGVFFVMEVAAPV